MDVEEKHGHDASQSDEHLDEIYEQEIGIAPFETEKSGQILAACEGDGDLIILGRLATSRGGLLNDDLRQIICR